MSRYQHEDRDSGDERYQTIVCSIDYDGCISSANKANSATEMMQRIHDLLTDNPDAQLILMIGSARQTIAFNFRCEQKYQNGSCFTFMSAFLNTFKEKYPALSERITFDPFLLEDIAYNKPAGTYYELDSRLSSTEKGKGISRISWQDKNKIALLYAQMHHIASLHQHHPILFHFFDDQEDILNTLMQHYHSDLIPNNIDLHCFQYSKRIKRHHFSITGAGYIDFDYYHNVRYYFFQQGLKYAKTVKNAIETFQPKIVTIIYLASTQKEEIIKHCVEYADQGFMLEFIHHCLSPEDQPRASKHFLLQLFHQKKYDAISYPFSNAPEYIALARICKNAAHQHDGILRKTFLYDLLMHFKDHGDQARCSYYHAQLLDLYYQQRALSGEILPLDALITIRTILHYFHHKKTLTDELIECILLSILSVTNTYSPLIPPQQNKIYQRVMYGHIADFDDISSTREKIWKLIDAHCKASGTQMQNAEVAYRALRLVVLSMDISSPSEFKAAISHWKTAPTKITGKNNWQLLEDADQNPTQHGFMHTFFSFISGTPPHTNFVQSLPDRMLECTPECRFQNLPH